MKHIFFALTLLACSAPLFAINKCTANGNITYTDVPCSEDAQSTEFTRQVIPPDDTAAAKRQHLANQKKLQKITQQRAKEEKQWEREAQATARQIKKDKDREFRCNELDLKRKSAREDQSEVQLKGNRRAIEKARMRAKQAENRYVHYCKS